MDDDPTSFEEPNIPLIQKLCLPLCLGIYGYPPLLCIGAISPRGSRKAAKHCAHAHALHNCDCSTILFGHNLVLVY